MNSFETEWALLSVQVGFLISFFSRALIFKLGKILKMEQHLQMYSQWQFRCIIIKILKDKEFSILNNTPDFKLQL